MAPPSHDARCFKGLPGLPHWWPLEYTGIVHTVIWNSMTSGHSTSLLVPNVANCSWLVSWFPCHWTFVHSNPKYSSCLNNLQQKLSFDLVGDLPKYIMPSFHRFLISFLIIQWWPDFFSPKKWPTGASSCWCPARARVGAYGNFEDLFDAELRRDPPKGLQQVDPFGDQGEWSKFATRKDGLEHP
jgi:hypothetical protein